MRPYDYAVVGGGILGLATARELARRRPGARLVLLEKEAAPAVHQSGRNSGVLHAGVYYPAGSLKARFARAGNRSMAEYCRSRGLPHEICGKLIVATEPEELPRLEALRDRALANGLAVRSLNADEVAEREPHVRALAALEVPTTGIVDFRAVCRSLASDLESAGAEVRVNAEVERVRKVPAGFELETQGGAVVSSVLVNCAGLHSDRVARMCGVEPGARIVPFRGEYYELRPERRDLVRGLVYPVPNPDFPFLGVHLTRGIDGGVHAGPNAVLALAREGYGWGTVRARDAAEVAMYGGFWRLALRHGREGLREVRRSLSKRAFVRSLQRLVPAIEPDDVVPAPAGVRAQALGRDGRLIDDFLIVESDGGVHVCNAPSPGATASLEIGKAVADRVLGSTPLAAAV